MNPENSPSSPFYLNLGVLIGTPELLRTFYQNEKTFRSRVTAKVGPWWCAQVALSLTCSVFKMPVRDLGMRYNFPNDPIADMLYAKELPDIIFLHYLREDRYNRHNIFADRTFFEQFLTLDLVGSDKVLQEIVMQHTNGQYPFARIGEANP